MEARLTGRAGVFLALLGCSLALTAPSRAAQEQNGRFDAMVADVKATMLADPREAIRRGEATLRLAREKHSPSMVATAQWLLGEAYLRTNDPQQALKLLNDAQHALGADGKGSHLQADILLSQGGARTATGEVAMALVNLHRLCPVPFAA